MREKGAKLAESPGCMTLPQISALKNALKIAGNDPSLLCDLEGCGPVSELEREFALICGTRFALAVSSGTAAIHAAFLAAGVGPGDEVIVTPYSWPQSVTPVIFSGATPVFADIDPLTLNLDPESVLGRISSKTRAILPVHLFGHPADMVQLEKIAGEIGAVLISDAAHALGAKLNSRPIGAWGNISCFSLGRGKLVSGGEGGIITTDDEILYEKVLALTQHPERVKRIKGFRGFSEEFGLNFRIHPLADILALSD
jgi:dTDP-4-amino-4,6-dideoxygalactose transaminase